jgi:histidinol dehydrogenase
LALTIRRIDCDRDDAEAAIAALRDELSPKGNVVSPEGQARTIAAFGEPLTPPQVVERICNDVASRGLAAVLDYTRRLDGVELEPERVRVSAEELRLAYEQADGDYLATIERVAANIRAFQTAILHADVTVERGPGINLGVRYRPIRRAGVCVPGGAAAYPSTVLMTVVPAQAAGVPEVAVIVPPTRFGGFNVDLLAACHALGVSEVYRVGGAQGVAAMAYGVPEIGLSPVDKIVGPGNLFVALAKRHVYGEVDIDSIAGPSEVVVIADESANPDYLAADLISQAEHSPGASILLTWDDSLIDRVIGSLEDQLSRLSRGDLARASLDRFGALIRVRSEDEAVRLSNLFAPEHLHVSTADPKRLLPALTDAGAIFLGHDAPVAVGDYAAGPSHVLPTGGTARWASGLSANDFLRRTSLLAVDRKGLARLAPDVCRLADKEGLSAHRYSVEVRLGGASQG